MDSVSQFVLGAAIGQMVLGKKSQGKGALLGGIAATIPDLDFIPLIGSSVIAQLKYHRGFTHSIFFSFLAPFLLTWFSQRWWSVRLSRNRWWWFWFLIFFTHIILDLMTTWGTQIFWPFSPRIAFNSLFIIDPLLTLPLIIGCILTKIRKTHMPVTIGLWCCSLYLLFAVGAHQYMAHQFKSLFNQNQINVESFMVRPTPFNTLYWSVTARTPTDDLVVGYGRLWDSVDQFEVLDKFSRQSKHLKPFIHDQDVQFLLQITNGYYVIQRNNNQLIIQDARYGSLGFFGNSTRSFAFNYQYDVVTKKWTQFRSSMPSIRQLLKRLVGKIVK